MSDDKSNSSDGGTPLNEEVFSLFIFKIGPQSMKAAEGYLKNRNWTVGSASGMREALAYIIQKKPQFVMVAADHPNKKVRIFPSLISQAFPVKVIAFSEGSNTTAMNALREMNLPLTLFPPVSGPSIERLIRKILKEEKEEAELQEKLANQMEAGGNGDASGQVKNSTIRLKGESATADDLQRSFEQARTALMALADAGDEEDQSGAAYTPGASENRDPNSPGYSIASGSRTKKGPAFIGQDQDKNSPSFSGYIPESQSAQASDMEATQEGRKVTTYSAEQGSTDSKDLAANQQGAEAANYSTRQQSPTGPVGPGKGRPQGNGSEGDLAPHPESSDWETPDTQRANSTDEESPVKNSSDNSADSQGTAGNNKKINRAGVAGSESSADSSQTNLSGLSAVEKAKSSDRLYIKGVEKQLSENDSLIVKGSVEAMDNSVKELRARDSAADLSPDNEKQTASNIHCITVDSPRFSGYLVAALGKNRSLDKAFIDTVKQRLYNFLKSNGETVSDENPFDIKIKEVPFEDWAIQQAEFLRKSIHNGQEIAMAFFPNPKVSLKLEASGNDKMVQISLDELTEDVALDFDLYIYMPENDKFLLYTPEGKPLYGKQKSRLKEKGLTHMHLRKDSVNSVKKYRAQNFLNSKIDSYNNDPKNKDKNKK